MEGKNSKQIIETKENEANKTKEKPVKHRLLTTGGWKEDTGSLESSYQIRMRSK